MNFGEALAHLKKDPSYRVTRESWTFNGHKPVISIQTPDEKSKMTKPYLYMEKWDGLTLDTFPINLSCESIMAEDWELVI